MCANHFSRVTSKGIKAETANKTRDGRKSSIRRPLESIGIIRLAPQPTGTEGGKERPEPSPAADETEAPSEAPGS